MYEETRIMTFRPSLEDLENFSNYIDYMESRGAYKAGIVKVIPPYEWNPSKNGYKLNEADIKIQSSVSQNVTGKYGKFQLVNTTKKLMTLKDFHELAESEVHRTPNHFDYDELEKRFWNNIPFIAPIYGTNATSTLTDLDLKELNINSLGTILDCVENDFNIKIEGVNTPRLHFNMWKTNFGWHTEYMDLYSINYLHFGLPKTWYSIPPKYGRKFEQFSNRTFEEEHKICNAYLHHKSTLINPKLLKQNQITFYKIVQEPGEFIITFPFGYHCGFNHGFNVSESINFATLRWIEYGKKTTICRCRCRKGMIQIPMDNFVKKFQPEKYENWLLGDDHGIHPEDTENIFARAKTNESKEVLKQRDVNTMSTNVIEKKEDCETFGTGRSIRNLSKENIIKNVGRMRFQTKVIDLFEKNENEVED